MAGLAFLRHRRAKRFNLFLAAVLAFLGTLAVAVLLWPLIGFALHGFWTWGLPPGETTRAEATRIVLTITAGAGGVVALTVAYRKQNVLEQGRFMDSLAIATRQLGDHEATVQFAGIYSLSALADESDGARRQLCVDMLCAYLRLPYAPQHGSSLLQEAVHRRTWHHARGSVEDTNTYRVRPADREVRLTIIREITNHLRPDATVSWSGLDLDFTGATFDGGSFEGARLTGGRISFSKANFTADTVSFRRAEITGGAVSFEEAYFSGGNVSFADTKFRGGSVSYYGARFTGSRTSFRGAKFSGSDVSFEAATFNAGNIAFDSVEFAAGHIAFDGAVFKGSRVSFSGANFKGSRVSFEGAEFKDGRVRFALSKFTGGNVYFDEAEGGTKPGVLSFQRPAIWGSPPSVPWDSSTVPVWVWPSQWPPEIHHSGTNLVRDQAAGTIRDDGQYAL